MMNQGHLEVNQTIAKPHKIWVEPQPGPAIYKHQPLNSSSDEIRLLKLRKSNEGPLCCEIQIFPLRQAPEYIALSYRWGPPSPLHDIFVGDQRLKIRDILNSCLLELREDMDAWLWIDQMCIAQADTTERNHQVGMMSRVYSNATSVIIWLSDIPLAPLGEVDRFNDQDLDAGSIIVLLNNIYFTRLWIVQEILLAKNVRIHLNGKRCVAWKKLQNEYSTMLKLVGLGTMPRAIFGLMNYTRKRWDSKPQLAWTRCISNFSANACGDARDKVYAMMGIVDEEDRLTVDYNKSVLEVFLDVVNTFKHPIARTTLENCLYLLGTHMGIELLQDLEHLAHERLEKSLRKTVSPIRFKKADHEEQRDYWWYECNGKKSCYPRPPSASPAAPYKHTSGISGRTM